MRPKTLYLGLCFVGTILPYIFFLPFLLEHGVSIPLIVEQLFVNRISSSFGMDVLASSIVLCALVVTEGRRARVRHLWAPILGLVTVGVSLGLPLFLHMRERKLETSGR